MKSKSNHQKNIIAASISIGTAIFLGMIKGGAGFFTGSLALFASALDSILDAFSSLVNLLVIRESVKPPDRNHRFGHGKFEAFAEFSQGVLIAFSGFFLAKQSLWRMLYPEQIQQENIAIIVMTASFIITFFLVLFLRKTAKNTGSLVVKADSAHYYSDLLSNFAIIAGLILLKIFEVQVIDSLLSFGISLLILWSAVELLTESFRILTDHELPKKARDTIENILNSQKKPISSWHQLRTRRSGTQVHIDYHLVFNDTISLHGAHEISEKIEQKIRNSFPHAVVLTHLDPHDDSVVNKEALEN